MKDFAAIDFETANYEPTSICSIGVVVVRNGVICDTIYRLVRPEPEYYINRFTQIHGIQLHDTLHAPCFAHVWKDIAAQIEGLPLIAHNKAFDQRILLATCRMYGIAPPDVPFYCTLQQARRKIPATHIENHRLPTVCNYLGIDFDNHHHALADAIGCARIAQILFDD